MSKRAERVRAKRIAKTNRRAVIWRKRVRHKHSRFHVFNRLRFVRQRSHRTPESRWTFDADGRRQYGMTEAKYLAKRAKEQELRVARRAKNVAIVGEYVAAPPRVSAGVGVGS